MSGEQISVAWVERDVRLGIDADHLRGSITCQMQSRKRDKLAAAVLSEALRLDDWSRHRPRRDIDVSDILALKGPQGEQRRITIIFGLNIPVCDVTPNVAASSIAERGEDQKEGADYLFMSLQSPSSIRISDSPQASDVAPIERARTHSGRSGRSKPLAEQCRYLVEIVVGNRPDSNRRCGPGAFRTPAASPRR